VAESEKAIHIGFFLNGKRQAPFPGEERVVVPSPHGLTPAEMPPEMSAAAVADAAIAALQNPEYALVSVNLCNVDVIGHIGNPDSIRVAVETVDAQAGRIVQAAQAAAHSANAPGLPSVGVTTILTPTTAPSSAGTIPTEPSTPATLTAPCLLFLSIRARADSRPPLQGASACDRVAL